MKAKVSPLFSLLFVTLVSCRSQIKEDSTNVTVGVDAPVRVINVATRLAKGSCEAKKICCPGRIDGCFGADSPVFANCYCDEFCMENNDCCLDYIPYCQGKFRCWDADKLGNPCNKVDLTATCYDSGKTYGCACSAGHVYDTLLKTCVSDSCGVDLVDSNPCNDKGDLTSKCTPNVDGFTCSCSPGWQFIDGVCQDIDECAAPIPNMCNNCGSCYNTDGSYFCICDSGYRVSNGGKSCESLLDIWLNVIGLN